MILIPNERQKEPQMHQTSIDDEKKLNDQYLPDINHSQQQQLIALYCLSRRVGFDVGSWFINEYQNACLEEHTATTLIAKQFVESLRIPEGLIEDASEIQIKAILTNYADIHHSNMKMNPMHNVAIICSYITQLHSILHKKRHNKSNATKFRIAFIPSHLPKYSSNDKECIKSDRKSRGDEDVFAAFKAMIDSIDDKASLVDISIVRCSNDSENDDDIVFLTSKTIKHNLYDIRRYDSLMDYLEDDRAVAKHDGILTLSYIVSSEFDTKMHLFSDGVGVQLFFQNMSKMFCLLFGVNEVQLNLMNDDIECHRESKIIYIPKEYTAKAVVDDSIVERFETKEQLFYYLRWRSYVLSIDGHLRGFIVNHKHILVYCSDLHRSTDGAVLYVVGIKNDKTSSKRIEKWKMCEYLMTASQIEAKYGINARRLASVCCGLNDIYQTINTAQLIQRKKKISMEQYAVLPCIKTNKRGTFNSSSPCNVHVISKQRLMRAIKQSNRFVPIISINEKRSKYFVDMVLLIDIGDRTSVWIGVIFSQNANYHPVGLAIDCVDIQNKMRLFQPPSANTKQEQIHMHNDIAQLAIVHSEVMYDARDAMIADLRTQNANLRQQNTQQQNIIMCLQQTNTELSEINNHYFTECLNPNCNIKPHPVHDSFLRQTPLPVLIVSRSQSPDNDNNDQKGIQ
eukprot:73877_1